MKITKKDYKEILEACLETGADFAEIYLEDKIANNYAMINGKLDRANSSNLYGASIRILQGVEESFGYTSDLSKENLLNLARKLNASFNAPKKKIKFTLKEEEIPKIIFVERSASKTKLKEKIKLLARAEKGLRSFDSKEIIRTNAVLTDEEQYITVINTLGVIKKDLRSHLRLSVSAVASDGKNMQDAFSSKGGNCGYELFDNFDIEKMGYETSETAVKMLHADEMKSGKMTVVIDNGFGGVLLHEACVHSLEATSVAKGSSVFCNMLGKQIASPIVTAIDDGTIPNAWGSLNIDDEGNETKRNVLIKDGILQSYLVDFRNDRTMKHGITGSGRRQNFKYSPTSRMTNTFFAPGDSTFEEIIKNTESGFFAKSMGGGSVNPATGEFNFAVNEGYLIENGKITKPVRGATLVGSGAEILANIDMIANNLEFSYGMCGSLSGQIPTIVGQPTIRVQNITVGGKGN